MAEESASGSEVVSNGGDEDQDDDEGNEDQDHLASAGAVPRSDADHLQRLDSLGITSKEELPDSVSDESDEWSDASEQQEDSNIRSLQSLPAGEFWFRKRLARVGLEAWLRAAADGESNAKHFMHGVIRACNCHVQVSEDLCFAEVFATNSQVAAKAERILGLSSGDLEAVINWRDNAGDMPEDCEETECPEDIQVSWISHKSHRSFYHDTTRPSFMNSPATQSFRPSLRSWTFKHRLDPVQTAAIACVEQRESVLLSAPTSAGKTAIAIYAVAMALHEKKRAIYTTPIKALSNQKFMELGIAFGGQYVGIMTGDTVIASDAPIVVMTLEILQSMLYKQARDPNLLDDFACVVIDEAHFLGDIERGYAWEEVLVLLPLHIKLVLLSATVPNAAAIAEWCARVRTEPVHVITSEQRPVTWSNWHSLCQTFSGI